MAETREEWCERFEDELLTAFADIMAAACPRFVKRDGGTKV